MKRDRIATLFLGIVILAGCESFLDPMPNGHYTNENISEYPSLMKGFVDKAYAIANINRNNSYLSYRYAYLDCSTEDAVMTAVGSVARQLATNTLNPRNETFNVIWEEDFSGIHYTNLFLEDDKGYKTQYLTDHVNDSTLRSNYKGDAFALRAWFEYDLLRYYGGKDKDGNLSGFPILTYVVNAADVDAASFKRDSFDKCVQQIIDDCDSALVYLPYANRDFCADNLAVQGSMRWTRFDQVSVMCVKALTYLLWASDAFNPGKDATRWQKAAECAEKAMKFKIDYDFPKAGVTAYDSFLWSDPNSYECYFVSKNTGKSSEYETSLYPVGFRGSATFAPSQNLVDAFPMKNGYPITDIRSGYNPAKPYDNRDPRFYDNIFYNGANVMRDGTTTTMYTFETYSGGKDQQGLSKNSLTNYYVKKFLYFGWNGNDITKQTVARANFMITWRDMCLAFAEAANRFEGPTGSHFSLNAKQALAYLRGRTCHSGDAGLGASSDPYLDECSGSKEKFEELVRNERRIELCFEGKRFLDLARWGIPLSERNQNVCRPEITKLSENTFSYDFSPVVYRINLASAFLPIPFSEIQKAPGLVQNEGWDKWNIE